MNMIIHANKGVGEIHFGMTPDEVRNAMKVPWTSFMKTPNSEYPTDSFDSEGVHVYYKRSGACEAVEMGGRCNVVIENTELLGKPFAEIEKFFTEKLDSQVEIDCDGLTSYKLGIGIYCPDHEDDEMSNIQGVIVFEQGYYD